jgi:hypothetical protein
MNLVRQSLRKDEGWRECEDDSAVGEERLLLCLAVV